MIIKTILSNTCNQILETNKVNHHTAKFEAQLLLQYFLKVNHAWLIAHAFDTLQDSAIEAFQALLTRRLNGEPIAYILGYREFYGLALKVTADTLIPRPDTETIVEAALAKIPQHCIDTILDLGTGSGAIALAIAFNRPQAKVTAIDASQAALDIAIKNAKNLNIHNIVFTVSHWFDALNQQKFNLIVSNPPYIKQTDIHLKQGDLRFEPLSALASGEDGLDDIRHIICNAPNFLKPNGWLMLEHGYDQAQQVAHLFAQAGFKEISHVKDLAGILRVTIARYVAT